MADVKISELTAQASANVDVSADVLALVDTSATQTKKISVENLLSPITIDKSAGTITALGTVTGNVDLNGAVQIDATFTSGVDGQGYDTKFFGDTSNAYMMWDTSEDALVFGGSAVISTQDATVSGVLKSNGGVVFNEDSADVDFRVESNGNTHMLFVDAGNDRVGIATASPTHNLTVGDSSASDFVIALRGGVGGFLGWDDSANTTILQAPNTRALSLRVNSDTFGAGTEAMSISSSGNTTFAGTINSTIANTQTHSENTEPNSTTEFLTLHNNSGSDGAHTDKYVTMKMAVGSGAASEGHLIYRSSADNQGEFIFNSRHAGSTYNDILTLKSDKSATFAGAVTVATATNYAMTIKSTDADAADIFRIIADDDGALLTLSKDASDDAELYLYDGSGNANVQISGNNVSYFKGGDVGIGTTSINSNAKLHIRGGDSGQTSSSNNTQLTVEGSGSAGIQILAGTTNVAGLWIGDSNGSEAGGKLYYNNNDDAWSFYNAGSVNSLILNGNGSASFAAAISTPKGVGYVVHNVTVSPGSTSTYNLNGMGGNCAIGLYAAACMREGSTTQNNTTHIGVHQHTQGSNTFSDLLTRTDNADSSIVRSGSSLVCTNNESSVNLQFIVKYFNLISLDTSNNLA